MAQGGEDPAREVKQGVFRVPHDVFDVIPEDPEVQHIADEVHPAAVEEHAREQRRIGGNGHDRFGEVGLSEQEGRNRPVLEHEGVVRADRKVGLVEKDEHAGCNRGDRNDRRQFSRVVVVQRDHGVIMRRGGGDGR